MGPRREMVEATLARARWVLAGGALLVACIAAQAAAQTVVTDPYVSVDTTWDAAGSPYVLDGVLTINSDATLTIEPGVTVDMSGGGQLMVGDPYNAPAGLEPGRLVAVGTSSQPVTFLQGGVFFDGSNGAARDSRVENATFTAPPAYGVEVYAWDDLTIRNATFLSPGYAGVYVDEASPIVEDSLFEGGEHGLYADWTTAMPVLRGNTFRDQTIRWARVAVETDLRGNAFEGNGTAVELIGGYDWYDRTVVIRDVGVPYDLTGWIGASGAGSIVVEPGVTLRGRDGAYLTVTNALDSVTTGVRYKSGSYAESGTAVRFANATQPAGGCEIDGPDLFGYTCAVIPHAWTDIEATGTSAGVVCDDCTNSIPIGFDFTFYGATHASVIVSSNGFLTFESSHSGCCEGQLLPDASTPNALIAGYWEDLLPTAGGSVKYQTVGEAPERALIVQYTGVPHYSAVGILATFQIVLREGSGYAEVHFLAANPDGGRHVTGVESPAFLTDATPSLVLEGTQAKPIVLDVVPESYWYGVDVEGPADVPLAVRNVTIRGASGDGMYVRDWAGVLLDNVTIEDPTSSGLYVEGSSFELRATTFRGGSRGLYVFDPTESPALTGVTFVDQTYRHARITLGTTLTDVSFAGTGAAVELTTGSVISTDLTLPILAVPIELVDSPVVRGGATLTLPPGLRLAGPGWASVTVGDPALASVTGLRYAYGNYSVDATGVRFGTTTTPSGCASTTLDAYGYGCATIPYDFTNISTTGRRVALSTDQVSAAIPLSFAFDFYGRTYTEVYISSNGFLTFTPTTAHGCCSGQALPSATLPDAVVAGYWENLNPARPGASISVQTLGEAPARVFIAQWTAVPHYVTSTSGRDPVTFQIVLREGSNDIEVHLETAPSDGGTHVTGIESHVLPGASGGRVLALGTQAEPIVIESTSGDPASGWRGFVFRGANGAAMPSLFQNVTFRNMSLYPLSLNAWDALTLDNVTIENSLAESIYLVDSSPLIRSTSIVGGSRGIYASSWTSQPTIESSTFRDQTVRWARVGLRSDIQDTTFEGTGTALEVLGGARFHDTDVSLRDLPPVVELVEWLGVRSDATLTLEPGLHMRASGAALLVGDPSVARPGGLRYNLGNYSMAAQAVRFSPDGIPGRDCEMPGPDAGGYACGVIPYNWTDVSAVGTRIGSDMAHPVPLGFPFVFYGREYSHAYVSGNGFLTFDAGSGDGCCSGQGVPASTPPNNLVAGYWEQLHLGIPGATLHHATLGAAPDRSFVLQWTNVPHFVSSTTGRDPVTFQIVLREGSNDVEVHFLSAPSDGGTHMTGIEGGRALGGRGFLVAEGTASQPIVLESTSGSPGAWTGLILNGASESASPVALRNVTIRHAYEGVRATSWDSLLLDNVTLESSLASGLALVTSSPTVTSCTFVGGQRGIDATSWQSVPTLRGNVFRDQTVRWLRVGVQTDVRENVFEGTGTAIELLAGSRFYDTSLALRGVGVPYDLVGWAGVRNDSTLTLEPGLTVRGTSSAQLVVGDPSHQRVPGLRARYGSYSLNQTSFRFATGGPAGTSCASLGHDEGGYACHVVPFEWTNISANGTAITLADNAVSAAIPLGFEFPFYGVTYTSAYVSSNGFLTFSAGAPHGCCSGPFLPDLVAPSNLVAGYWEDLNPALAGASVRYKTLGSAPERSFVVQFTAVQHRVGSTTGIEPVTFQIVLQEGSGAVEVRIERAVSDGGTHVTGIEGNALPVAPRAQLVAEGTAAAPIGLEALSGTPSTAWTGLVLQGTGAAGPGSAIRNATIRHANVDGIHATSWPSLVLDNVTIERTGTGGVRVVTTPTQARGLRFESTGYGVSASGPVVVDLADVVVSNATTYGVTVSAGDTTMRMTDVLVDGSRARPLKIPLHASMTNVTIRASAINEVEYTASDVTIDLALPTFHDALTLERATSVLTGTVNVLQNATWTVPRGSLVNASQSVVVNIGATAGTFPRGGLVAEGTAAEPVVFRSRTGINATGWSGIRFNGGAGPVVSSTLRNVTFELANTHAIQVTSYSTLLLDNVTAARNNGRGISVTTASPTLNNFVATDSNSNGAFFTGSSSSWTGGRVERSNGIAVSIQGTGTVTMRGIAIDRSVGSAVDTNSGTAGANLHDVAVANVVGRPLRLPVTALVENVSITNASILEVEWHGANLAENRTLVPLVDQTGARLTHAVLSGFTIHNGSTWTIPAGSRVLLANGVAVNAGASSFALPRGGIQAVGTQEEPINLTSRTGVASTGWTGLFFYGVGAQAQVSSLLANVSLDLSKDDGVEVQGVSTLLMDNVTSSRNARYGVNVNGGAPALRNVTVKNSASHGIFVQASGNPSLQGVAIDRSTGYGLYFNDANSNVTAVDLSIQNSTGRPARVRMDTVLANLDLANNAVREIELWGRDITSGAVTLAPSYDRLTGERYTLVVVTTFAIHNGGILELLEDVKLAFAASQQLNVGRQSFNDPRDAGYLYVNATRARPVRLAGLTSAMGSWAGVDVVGRGVATIRNATIENATSPNVNVANVGQLLLDNASILRSAGDGVSATGAGPVVTIHGSLIANNTLAGVRSQTATLNLYASNVTGNQNGVELRTQTATTLRGNTILGNARAGVNATSGNPALNAQQNTFWGNAAYGVDLQASTGSLIADNVFLNNGNQHARATALNTWNLTKTPGRNVVYGPHLGGNYWSGFDVADLDGDGLGDANYTTNLGPGRDNLPLMGDLFADFRYLVPDVEALPHVLSFVDLSRGGLAPADQWVWDMGDGGQYTTQNATHTFAADGWYTVTLTVANAMGQIDQINKSIPVDSVVPGTSFLLEGAAGLDGWYLTRVNVTLVASDDRSGVALTRWRVDNGSWNVYGGVFNLSADGAHWLEFQSVDKNGNTEPVRAVQVKIDTTLPTANLAGLTGEPGLAGWYVGPATIELAAADATSGVDAILYALDAPPATTYAGPFVVDADGVHHLRYRARDAAGNLGPEGNVTLRVDQVAPAVVFEQTGPAGGAGWFLGDVSVAIAATDATSGVWHVNASLDGAPMTPVVGNISVAGHGNHTLAVNATDVAGNLDPVERIVRIDTVPPTSEHHFNGTIGVNGVYISNVTVTFTGNDSGSGLDHVVYSLDFGPNLTYAGEVAIDTEGEHRLVYHAVDAAGNAETIHEVVLYLDITPPDTRIELEGVNALNGWWGSNLTATLLTNDSLDSIFYSLDGGSLVQFLFPFAIDGEGVHNLTFHSVSSSGLKEPDKHETPRIDLHPPTVGADFAGTAGLAGWYVSPVQATLRPQDSASGVATTLYDVGAGNVTYTGPISFATTGVHHLNATALDVSGRAGGLGHTVVRVDLSDPVTTVQLSPSAPDGTPPWYTSPVSVAFSAADAGSGVARILASVDGGPEEIVTAPLVLGEGVHEVAYRAVDVAGRVEVARVLTVSVDLTPPTLDETVEGTQGLAGWLTSPATVTLLADDATSGVSLVRASVDGGPESTVTAPLSIATTGTHPIAWRAVDAAGLSTLRNVTLRLDLSPPVTSAALSNAANGFGWRASAPSVTLTSLDAAGGSGVATIQYALDGAAPTDYTGPFVIPEGLHNLTFFATDVAGLVETIAPALPVRVDLTNPTGALSAPASGRPDGWHLAPIPVTITGSDGPSGLRDFRYQIDTGSFQSTSGLLNLTLEGVHTLRVAARDFADRLQAPMVELPFKLDLNPPTSSHALSGTFGGNNRTVAWYRTPVTFTMSSVDAASGVAGRFTRVPGGENVSYGGAITFAQEGSYNLSYFALDLVDRVEAAKNVPAFGVDLTPPTTTPNVTGVLDPADGVYKSPVNITLLSFDALSGVASGTIKVSLDGAPLTTYAGRIFVNTSGDHSLMFQARDVAGNLEVMKYVNFTVFFDVTPPVTSVATTGLRGEGGWFRSNVTVFLNATDLHSSVHALLVRVDGATDLTEVVGSRANLTLASEGLHVIEYAAIDIAGNLELFRNVSVGVDLTPPSVAVAETATHGKNGWIVSPVSLVPTGTDALAGVLRINASVNGAPFSPASVVDLTLNGFHNVSFYAVDRAGLVSPILAWSGRIDAVPPTLGSALVGPEGLGDWYRGNVTALLSAGDGLSGVGPLRYSLDGTAPADYAGPVQIGSEGLHTLAATVEDLAGNLATLPLTSFGIDATRPQVAIDLDGTPGNAGWWISEVTATTTALDAAPPGVDASGIHNVTRVLDGGPNGTVALPDVVVIDESGVHTIAATALDTALNAASLSTTIPVDVDDPTLLWTREGVRGENGWFRGPVDLTTTSLDPTSGPLAPTLPNGTPMPGFLVVDGDGLHEFLLTPRDVAGRAAAAVSVLVPIDTTPPTLGLEIDGPFGEGGWLNGPAQVSLLALDATSGLGELRYRVGNGSFQAYAGPIAFTSDGIHALEWLGVDLAGNVANRTFLVKIDTEAPVAFANLSGVVGNNSWFRGAVNITLDASDLTSGVAQIEYSLNGGAFVPYVGPFTLDLEGRHTLRYRGLDGSGLPSIVYEHVILIDATTPVIDLHLENTLFIEFDGKLYIRGTLCIEVSGLDLLSGLNDLYLRVTGIVTKLVKIELEVGLHCIDLEGEGGGGGGGCLMCAIATDLAGNEVESCLEGVFDPIAPSVDILRPFPGALNVQNMSIPLFSTAFGHGAAVETPGVEFTIETPDGEEKVGGTTRVSGQNATLAQTRLVAGTRVPVWVVASDGLSPITRVELAIDGDVVGVSNRTQNVTFQYVVMLPKDRSVHPGDATATLPPDEVELVDGAAGCERASDTPCGEVRDASAERRRLRDEHAPGGPEEEETRHELRVVNVTLPVHVFEIDTLALEAGDHELSATARDVPGNIASVARLVGYVSPAVGNATVNAIEDASRERGTVKEETPRDVREKVPSTLWDEETPDPDVPDVPPEQRPLLARFLTAARIAAQLYDFLAVDNYAFIHQTVIRHHGLYEATDDAVRALPAAPPPVVVDAVYLHARLVDADDLVEMLPLPEDEEPPEGGDG